MQNTELEEKQALRRVCLVHYHEIGLKGHNRAQFEKRLVSNIKALLNDGVKIKRISGRIALFLDEEATFDDACRIADQIAGVPGIARVSSGYRCAQDLECMYDTAIKALSDAGEFETFNSLRVVTIPISPSIPCSSTSWLALRCVVLFPRRRYG